MTRPMKVSSTSSAWLPMSDWVEDEACSALISRTTNEGKQAGAASTARPKSTFVRPFCWRSIINPGGPIGWAWRGLTKQWAHVHETPPVQMQALLPGRNLAEFSSVDPATNAQPAMVEGSVHDGGGKSLVIEGITKKDKGHLEQGALEVHHLDETLPDFSDSASELSSEGGDEQGVQVLWPAHMRLGCVTDETLFVAQVPNKAASPKWNMEARIAVLEARIAEAQAGTVAAEKRSATAVAAQMQAEQRSATAVAAQKKAEGRVAQLEAEKTAVAAHGSRVQAEAQKVQQATAATAVLVEKAARPVVVATGDQFVSIAAFELKKGQLKASQLKVLALEDEANMQAAEMRLLNMQVMVNEDLRDQIKTMKGKMGPNFA